MSNKQIEYYVTVGDKKYTFDLKRIKNVCYTGSESDREITEGYETDEGGKGLVMVNKIIREYKSNNNDQNSMITYDVVKLLILKLLESYTEDFEANLGLNLALNTCLKEGIIYEITD